MIAIAIAVVAETNTSIGMPRVSSLVVQDRRQGERRLHRHQPSDRRR